MFIRSFNISIIIALIAAMGSAKQYIADPPLDLVIVLQGKFLSTQTDLDDLAKKLDLGIRVFEMKTNMKTAVVAPVQQMWTIVSKFTSNVNDTIKTVKDLKIEVKITYDLHKALAMVRNQLFVERSRPKAKAVILFTDGAFSNDDDKEMAQNEARLLLNVTDVSLFNIYTDAPPPKDVDRIGSTRFFKDAGLGTFVAIQEVIDGRICENKSTCQFSKPDQCIKSSWYPLDSDAIDCCGLFNHAANCSMPPAVPVPCEKSECVKFCDDWWPWNGKMADCKTKTTCGPSIRKGAPPRKIFEHCQEKFECSTPCPSSDSTSPWTIISLVATGVILVIIGSVIAGVCIKRKKKIKKIINQSMEKMAETEYGKRLAKSSPMVKNLLKKSTKEKKPVKAKKAHDDEDNTAEDIDNIPSQEH